MNTCIIIIMSFDFPLHGEKSGYRQMYVLLLDFVNNMVRPKGPCGQKHATLS